MSSIAKAALISVVIFAVILAAAFFVLPGRGKKPPQEEPKPAPDVVVAPVAPQPEPQRGTPINPNETVARDKVRATVEVLERARKRHLPNSRLLVLRAIDGDRPGDQVEEKTGDGAFDVDLEPGAYIFRVSCPRFTGQKRLVTVIKDSPQKLVFELERGNSIQGKVLAKDGGPIAGARVLALRELAMPGADLEEILIRFTEIQAMTGKTAFAAEDISAADGSYSLDGLDVHAFTVRATAKGYLPGEVAEVPSPRVNVDLVLDKGVTVAGTVRDSADNVVAGAKVSAYPEVETQDVFRIIVSKARPPLDTVATAESGRFELKTLGPGLYNFLVEAPGYQVGEFTKQRVTSGSTELKFTLKPGAILRGVVTGPNGEPIVGAKIRATLMGSGAATRRDQVALSFDQDKTLTNEQGEFTADTLEEGTYMVLCWHQDYQTLRKTDVHVGGASSDVLKLKLSHGGRVRGLVNDKATGKPIAGARITVNDMADLHKDAVTSEDGTYVASGLGGATGSKTTSISVVAPGYSRVRRDNVKIVENREIEENFELEPTGTVSGLVVDPQGKPVLGARVMAKRANEGSSGVEQILANDLTDKEGKYVLTGIEAGDNTWVRVKKSDFLEGKGEPFSLAAAQSVDLPPITISQGGSVAGKVIGAGKKPVEGALVLVTNEGETERDQGNNPSSPTNARGEFLIQGLPSGKVDLVVKAAHYLEQRLSGVDVVEGRLHGDLTINLEQGNSVAGIVVDSNGKPIAGVEVLAKDFAQGLKELRAVSEPDGHFTVEGILATDIVELSASHENYAPVTEPKARVGATNLKLVLKEMGSLHGIVMTSDGKPVEVSFTVQAQNPGQKDPRKQPKTQTFTSDSGAFDYKGVPGGVYTVYVRAPPLAAATIPNVRVAEGEAVDLGTIELQAGGRVFGKVIDAVTKKPLEGARVQITQGSSRFLASAGTATGAPSSNNPVQTSASDGSFAYSGLKSGSLSLRISLDGYLTRKVDDVNPDVAEKSQDLSIELEQGGEISGTVFNPDGSARAGINVYLIGQDPSSNQTHTTDKDGHYRFQGVPAGSFTIKAHKFATTTDAGPEQAEQAIDMTPGGSLSLDLQLE